eukprot:409320-Pleurochrysis_carterae.AAC.1
MGGAAHGVPAPLRNARAGHPPARRHHVSLDLAQEAWVTEPICIHIRLPRHRDSQPLADQRPRAAKQLPHGRRAAGGR